MEIRHFHFCSSPEIASDVPEMSSYVRWMLYKEFNETKRDTIGRCYQPKQMPATARPKLHLFHIRTSLSSVDFSLYITSKPTCKYIKLNRDHLHDAGSLFIAGVQGLWYDLYISSVRLMTIQSQF